MWQRELMLTIYYLTEKRDAIPYCAVDSHFRRSGGSGAAFSKSMSFRALRGMTVFRMIDDVFQEAVPPENYH